MANTAVGYRTSPPGIFPGGDPATFADGTGTFVIVGVAGAAGGGGSVTLVSSGNLNPLFTVGIANPTTTPTFTFTASTFAAHGVYAGPATGSSAAIPMVRSLVALDLPNTTVTAATYGSASQVATFTVDAQGRLTAAGNVTITGPNAISGTTTTPAGYVKGVGGFATFVPSIPGTDIDGTIARLAGPQTHTGTHTFAGLILGNNASFSGGISVAAFGSDGGLIYTDGGGTLYSPYLTSAYISAAISLTVGGSDVATQAGVAATYAPLSSPHLTDIPTAPTAAPGTNTTQLATTEFVHIDIQNALDGLSWKTAVRVATTANGTLATAYENGDTVDGVVLATGDRILLKNQTTGTENGLYTVNASGAPTRTTDANTGAELVSATVYVSAGTTNADTSWVCSNDAITLGVTAITFVQRSGAGLYTFTAPITLTGNVVSLANTAVSAGSYGSDSQVATFTVDAQGRLTAAASVTITGTGTLTSGATGAGFTVALGTSTITGILGSVNGGTANGFTKFTGPTTAEKTFTLPNASAAILTDNAAVTVAQGGSGRATGTTAYALVATGTTATGAQQTLAAGATTEVLVGGGASALPVWTTTTGTGNVVRAGSPTITTPISAGPLTVRQTGGVAGTDEMTVTHDGAGNAVFVNLDIVSHVAQYSFMAGSRGIGLYVSDNGSMGINPVTAGYGLLLGSSTANLMQIHGGGSAAGNVVLKSDAVLGWSAGTVSGSNVAVVGLGLTAAKVIGLTDGSTGGGTLSSVPLSPAQITANTDNYAPGVAMYLRLSTDASRNLTGLVAGVSGEQREIWNVGSFNLVLMNDVTSTAANRFLTTTGSNVTLTPNGIARLLYDATTARWRVISVSLVGTTDGGNATAGNVGEYASASVVQGSALALTTATAKTVTSITLTAGDWDITGIVAITGASTGTVFDAAVGTTTNSFTGTVLGDTRCETPTVSLTGADASLMIPAVRVSISGSTTYYLIAQETFTIGTPAAYGRLSARRVR